MFKAQWYWLVGGVVCTMLNLIDLNVKDILLNNDLYSIAAFLFYGFSVEAGMSKARRD